MKVIIQLVPLFALALHARAHGVITAVAGANGVSGQGFGVIESTPRDGSRRNPFQQDSSIIRDREIERGDADVCGRTLAGGVNDVATQLNAAVAAGLPTASDDGSVTMTLHQVNGDGAGPYTCEVSTDATGANFAAMTVTTNVPGRNSRSNARATPFSLVAQMPAGTTCSGGPNGDACIVRCRNSARAGPFGGCVAVTNAGAGNATAAAAGVDTGVVDPAAAATDASGVVASGNVDGTGAANTVAADQVAANTGAVNTVAADQVSAVPTPLVAPGAVTGNTGAVAANGALPATGATSNLNSNVAGFARAIDHEDDEDVSIEEAELALAGDLDRRLAERVRRSRIVGRRAI